jgi:hypothetical protein
MIYMSLAVMFHGLAFSFGDQSFALIEVSVVVGGTRETKS